MGRYYQTAEPEFVQDIMYRPPWELAKEVLQKEQGDYDTAVAKTSLYGDVDMQHMDTPAEIENAQRIQQAYAQKSDALLAQLQAAGTDWRKAMPGLTKLGRELSSDFKTGDISKIETSAAQYAAMNKHLETIKDPATKEKAKQAYLNKFNQQARGSLDGVFSYDQTYDKKDLTGEFLAEKKNWDDPDITSAISQWKKDGYINSKTTSTKKLEKLKQAFGDFVKAKGYEPYLQQQEQFGLGQYFDPETKQLMSVDDKRSSLSSMGDYAAQGEYKQVTQSQDAKQDWILQMDKQHSWELQQANNEARQTMLSTPTKVAIVTTQEQIDKLNERFNIGLKALNRRIKAPLRNDGRTTPQAIEKKIKKLRANPKLSSAVRAQFGKDLVTLNKIRNQYVGNKTRAGYAVMANVFGPEVAQAAQVSYDRYTTDPRSLLPIKADIFMKGKLYRNTSITDIKNNPAKYGFTPTEIANIKGTEDTEGQDAKDMYIQGSAMPVIVGESPQDWEYNEMQNEWSLGGVPIRQQVNFKTLGLEYSSGTKQYKK